MAPWGRAVTPLRVRGRRSMPRFVILEHDYPERHWDFMVEVGESLWTWRLPVLPQPGMGPIPATRIGDHRRAYLDYEGPVSGNRGTVVRREAGSYHEKSVQKGRVDVWLQGGGLNARAVLEQIAGP